MELNTPTCDLTDGQKFILAELPLSSLTGEDDQGESLDYPDACPHCSHEEIWFATGQSDGIPASRAGAPRFSQLQAY